MGVVRLNKKSFQLTGNSLESWDVNLSTTRCELPGNDEVYIKYAKRFRKASRVLRARRSRAVTLGPSSGRKGGCFSSFCAMTLMRGDHYGVYSAVWHRVRSGRSLLAVSSRSDRSEAETCVCV